MGRVIQTNSVGSERTRLTKSIVLAIRELFKQSEPGAYAKDIAAYIVLALQTINAGIESSVVAWEKRGYWVKADRFRMDWAWSERAAATLKHAVLAEDWLQISKDCVALAERFNQIKVSDKHRLGKPWLGAWDELRKAG